MKSLSDYEPEELAELADSEFQETVQAEARSLVADAFNTYREVMNASDDDVARIKAADKIIALGGFSEKQNALPGGVSEEVFKLALAGLGQLAGIASASAASSAILRNVTPAKVDPRMLPSFEVPADDSPMNRKPVSEVENDNDAIATLIAKERYEIIERS